MLDGVLAGIEAHNGRAHRRRAMARVRRAAIDEALVAKAEGVSRVILFNLSGHGHFDLSAYDRYLAGALVDYEYPAEQVAKALERLPVVG